MHWRRKWQPTPEFLPGESQGRGAWWAAVYGVAQSQTRLKRLSSSSSSSTLSHSVVLTPCCPMDCSLPASSLHGILQAGILEWIAISSSRDLPDPRIRSMSPALQMDSLPSELPGKSQNVYTEAQISA